MSRPLLGRVNHDDWRGGRENHHNPDQRGERESEQRGNFQQQRMARRKVESNAKGQQEHQRRGHGEPQQREVNDAVQAAAAPTVGAAGEVALVVAAHLRSNAGNVIAPAGENAAHKFIAALRTHVVRERASIRWMPKEARSYSRIGASASDWLASNTRF